MVAAAASPAEALAGRGSATRSTPTRIAARTSAFRSAEGALDGNVITCAAHHYQYDALTGCGINPRVVCLVRFPVRIESGSVLVDPAAGYREIDQAQEGSHG